MEELMKDLKNNNEKFSDEYMTLMKQYYDKLMTNENAQKMQNSMSTNLDQPDAEGGVIITPNQCCCVKTFDSNGQKIFINITSHDKIDAPKEEHILEIENQLGVRLPMSLSDKYEDFDNNNQVCQVYDVIFNTTVVKKAEADPSVFQFLIQLTCERIKQKFNHEVSINFIKLKNLKYKGKYVKPQRVRVRVGPKIQEVIKNENSFSSVELTQGINSKEISKEVNEKGRTPNWNIIILKEEVLTVSTFNSFTKIGKEIIHNKYSLAEHLHNRNLQHPFLFFNGSNANPKYGKSLLYIIEVNLLYKSSGINLNVCDTYFSLSCPKLYSLNISIPYRVNSQDSFAFFDSHSRFLYVMFPFYPIDCEDFIKLENDKSYTDKNGKKNIQLTEDYLYDLVI